MRILFAGFLVVAGTAMAQRAEKAVPDRYCVSCHNDKVRSGKLSFAQLDYAKLTEDPEIWRRVVAKVRGGFMPPPGAPRPEKPELDSFTASIEQTLDRAALATPHPGRVALHRLNRAEYGNAIRDLLSLNIDPESLLPPDDSNNGFDNMADTLSFSPSLLERYLKAAQKISSLAVGDKSITPSVDTFLVHGDLSQDVHAEGLPLGTRGGIAIHYNFPLDAEYVVKTTLIRSNRGLVRGVETPSQLEVTLDGRRIHLAKFGGKEDEAIANENPPDFGVQAEKRFDVRVPVSAGPHVVTVAFLLESAAAKVDMTQPHIRNLDNTQVVIGVPEIATVTIGGPFNVKGIGDTPSRRAVFGCRPASAGEEAGCARKILTSLAKHAYRRPASSGELEQLIAVYQAGRSKSGDFDGGIRRALAQILTNPQFLFRFEPDPANVAPGAAWKLNDYELASRLSFFLWSSIPDDELLNLAAAGKLNTPAVLEQQVRRMLADEKSDALVKNFAGQWLYLRNLKRIAPEQTIFPDFDDNLRQAFLTETEMFCSYIMRGDHSVQDFLNANYTFLNERLAKHYGIRGVYGDQFRRVTLSDENRRGLLGQGSVLTVTSYATRTSAVVRGKWVLTNLLGTPPPPPPANVPALHENAPGETLTMRQRMEMHRADPVCASCHKAMDPAGLALENFDALGRWRTKDGNAPVDASAEFPDGTKVNGVADLRQHILSQPQQFVDTLTERLMSYALGRPTTSPDMAVVRTIGRESAKQDYRFSAIVLGIVKSPEFQMQTKPKS